MALHARQASPLGAAPPSVAATERPVSGAPPPAAAAAATGTTRRARSSGTVSKLMIPPSAASCFTSLRALHSALCLFPVRFLARLAAVAHHAARRAAL